MTDKNTSGNYYTIGHLVQFTGLTDRTIRNYISMGLLKGEKFNGIWHFSPEQVEEFMRNPSVKPSILAKNNAKVYDFILDTKKTGCQACIILDLPGEEEEKIMEYFCDNISRGEYQNIEFSYESLNDLPRIILKGATDDVLRLVNGYSTLRK